MNHRSSPAPRKALNTRWLLALGLLTTTLGAAAQAGDAPAARSGPRNLFDIGLWQATHDHRLQAGLRNSTFGGGLGEAFSLESDFGLRRKSDVTTLAYTRLIGAAWHVSVDRLESRRSAASTTPRNLLIFGQTLPAGTAVNASQRFAFTSVAGGLALVQRGDTEFGVRFGGGTVRDRVSYRWPGSTYESNLLNADLLPLLGLFVSARPGATLHLDARVDHLRERSSRSTQLRLGLRWQPSPHIGVEAAYWRLSGTSTPDDDIFSGNEESRYTLSGPRVALRLAF